MTPLNTATVTSNSVRPPVPVADPPSSVPDDVELMARVASGDENAMTDLYNRFRGLLFSVAFRIVGRRERAEEVVQDTFIYAWEKAENYSPERGAPSTWLALIARSRAIDRVRKSTTRGRVHDEIGKSADPPPATVEADKNVLNRERHDRVREAMLQLPDAQRQTLDLAYYTGLTQREIASLLDVPLGTVKTRTMLGFRKLRSALAQDRAELM